MLLTTVSFICLAQTATNKIPLWSQMQRAVLVETNLAEVKAIVKAGFDINSPIGCGSYNALDGAVQRGNVQMVKWLLANGAKPKGSALLQAARCDNVADSVQMVAALLKTGADVNYKENYPNPAFHSALPLSTPLHHACYNGNSAVVKLLLDQQGIELNTIDVDNYTPLMWAARKGNSEIVALLLKAGADPSIKNKNGETAFSMAGQHIEIQNQITNFLGAKKK
ncbi:MAG TPA: ankyrin repeat domain-containing protein [Verrucomicrobiae bacterium]